MAVGATATAAAAPARADTFISFETVTPNSTLCLEADPGPDFAYRVTTQPRSNQNLAQQWTEVAQGFSKFVNRAVGWCLDAHVPTPVLANAPVILWDCSATFSDERWQWGATNFGFERLQSRAWNSTGYCLTATGPYSWSCESPCLPVVPSAAAGVIVLLSRGGAEVVACSHRVWTRCGK